MKKQSTDHVVMRNGFPFCENCGQSFKYELPVSITLITSVWKAFIKEHKYCTKTWIEPTPSDGLSESQRMQFWLSKGERGISSETIYSVIGRPLRNDYCHPLDPDDFYRCYKLLKVIPEWRGKLYKMRSVSNVWNNLVDNWDKLTTMLEEQLENKKPNGMYEFMKSLGC